jgi:hypothetical protein
MQEPQPNTSGLNNKGGPIELSSEDSQLFSDVELTDDEDVCCVCNKWQPIEIARYGGINLRLCFFTTDVIVLVSKKLISPDCCSLSWLFSTSSVCVTFSSWFLA